MVSDQLNIIMLPRFGIFSQNLEFSSFLYPCSCKNCNSSIRIKFMISWTTLICLCCDCQCCLSVIKYCTVLFLKLVYTDTYTYLFQFYFICFNLFLESTFIFTLVLLILLHFITGISSKRRVFYILCLNYNLHYFICFYLLKLLYNTH